MADLAIGISKTVFEALVTKVKSAVKEEAELLQTVQRDLVFITDEFEMMQSFLNTAYGERIKSNVARTWVRQVRDISYDTEDCIESVVNMDTKPSLFQRLVHQSFFGQLLQFYQVQAVPPLNEVVSEIKLLKDRIDEVNQRNMRYSNISSNSGEQMTRTPDATQRTLVDFFLKQGDAMEDGIRKLTDLIITEDTRLQVISVYGTGGNLGAISIINKVCSDKKVQENFKLYAWLQPMHPFSVNKLKQSLLTEFIKNSKQKDIEVSPTLGGNESHDTQIDSQLQSILQGNNYLVVLEEVSNTTEWRQIIEVFKPYRNASDLNSQEKTKVGGRIIVSTQNLEAASIFMGPPYQASLLWDISTDHAVYAFKEPSLDSQPDGSRCNEWILSMDDVPVAHWRDDHKLYGRDNEIQKLYNEIISADKSKKHHVISVSGIAGIGKSFLVRTVLNHLRQKSTSFKKNIAVVSAPSPFDIKVFCWALLRSFDFKLEEHGDDDFVGKCFKHLDEHKCLVAIDDLGSIEDWVSIKANLISRSSKGCIVVITREESVARHCAMTRDAMFSIRGLEADEALDLFTKTVTAANPNSSIKDNLEEAAVIINYCGKLPKCIVALGDYFGKTISVGEELVHLKTNLMYELKTRKEFDSFREVLTWMHKTFQFWPQYLKKCIFYLSVFTESSVIRRSRLVQRWIAEGYCEVTDSNSMVENAEKLLGKLVTLGMLEQSPKTPMIDGDMRMTACHVKSLFVDYIISREMEENIFLPLEVSVLQGEGSMKVQRAGQHLAVRSSWKRDKFLFNSMDLSRIRSLTVSKEWKSFFISDRMRVLRVLDLEDTNVTNDDLKKIVKQLPRLKFLSLRRCKLVYNLPDSMDELNQLETLDIRHTCVAQLPYSIVQLHKLQYIRAGTSVALTDGRPSTRRTRRRRHGHVDAFDGVRVPHGIGELKALHTLGVINIDAKRGNVILKELKYLTQLRKLGLSGITQRNSKMFFYVIAGLGHLQSLSLKLRMDEDLDWLGKITLPNNLGRFKLCVVIEKFRHWRSFQSLGQMKRLQTLHLQFKTDQEVELQFCDRTNGTAWSTPNQFCELKLLEIDCSSSLHVKFADKDMVPLELLKVRCMDGASTLNFSGLEHTPSLKHVCVKGSFGETMQEELRQKFHQHGKMLHLNQEEPRLS